MNKLTPVRWTLAQVYIAVLTWTVRKHSWPYRAVLLRAHIKYNKIIIYRFLKTTYLNVNLSYSVSLSGCFSLGQACASWTTHRNPKAAWWTSERARIVNNTRFSARHLSVKRSTASWLRNQARTVYQQSVFLILIIMSATFCFHLARLFILKLIPYVPYVIWHWDASGQRWRSSLNSKTHSDTRRIVVHLENMHINTDLNS